MRILRYLSKRVLAIALAFVLISGTANAATVLPVPLGGTGASSFTSNAILKGNNRGAVQSSGVSIDSSNNFSGARNLVMDSSVYTVGPTGSGAKYITDGTGDQSEINQAMNDCVGASSPKCNGVRLLPNTYSISDLVTIPSGINLSCSAHIVDYCIIKAANGYTHATGVYGQDGTSSSLSYHIIVGNKTATLTNADIEWITFDANGQNTGYTVTDDGTNQAIRFVQCTDVTFSHNKVINSINWSLVTYSCTRLREEANIVTGGWSNTYTQNDGIHNRGCQYCYIIGNYIDTNGAGTSGDDSIAVGTDQNSSGRDSHDVIIANNVLSSNSRSILIFNSSTSSANFETYNILVSSNISFYSRNVAIEVQKIGNTNYGHLNSIKIDNNQLYNFGQSGAAAGDGAGIQLQQGTAYVVMKGIHITNNTIRRSVNTSYGYGINVAAKTAGLTINSNEISEIAAQYLIRVGGSSYPVTNFTINGNRLDATTGTACATNCRMILIYGGSRGVIAGNQFYGESSGGFTQGILIDAAATAGNDADGVANAESSQYLNVYGNELHDLDRGITEENLGADPNNNQFSNNVMDSVSTRYLVIGSASQVTDYDGTNLTTNKTFAPLTNDGAALGTSSLGFSDGFFASGAVLNFNNGDVTLTHSTDTLTLAGGTFVSPTITASTSLTSPLIIGGTGTTSTLTFKTTTGVGTTNADMIFQVGNNGATEAMRILNSGLIGIGISAPSAKLDVRGANIDTDSTTVGNLNVATTDAQAIDKGGSITLGGYRDDAATTYRNFASISGRKQSGTTGASDGYLMFEVNQAGGMSEKWRMTSTGHIVYTGDDPAVASGAGDCGTSPSITGSDNNGRVTVGSSTNGGKCTVTFAAAWTTAPICVANNETTGNLLRAASTTTTTVALTGTLTAGDKLDFICTGL